MVDVNTNLSDRHGTRLPDEDPINSHHTIRPDMDVPDQQGDMPLLSLDSFTMPHSVQDMLPIAFPTRH
jgi:hypothetical protein